MATRKERTGYHKGLRRVGDFYHYRVMFKGEMYQGSTKCKSQGDAELFLKAFLATKAKLVVGINPIPTLRVVAALWHESKRLENSPRHMADTMDSLEHDFPELADLTLDKIDDKKIQEWKNNWLEYKAGRGVVQEPGGEAVKRRTRSLPGVYVHLRKVNTLLHFAVKEKLIGAMPCSIYIPKHKKALKTRPYVVGSRFMELLEAVTKKSRHKKSPVLVYLMLGLGLREIEARKARWEWLDLDTHQLTHLDTKSGEKTPLPVPDFLFDFLVNLLGDGPKEGLIAPSHTGLAFAAGGSRAVLKAAAKLVGKPGLTPHRMRASFATAIYRMVKHDVKTAQEMLRHKDPQTTLLYLEADPDTKREVADGLDQVVKQGVAPLPAPPLSDPVEEDPKQGTSNIVIFKRAIPEG